MAAPQSKTPPRRADAQRSITAILDAALVTLSRDPQASVSEIAKAAGVGRVTLYGHFPNRTDLVDAAFARAVDEGHAALDGVDLSGEPNQALTRLIQSSWALVNRSRALLLAAQEVLPPGRIRELHAGPMERVQRLVERGRREGTFRTDLPTSWLVGVLHSVMHNAADEINAGRLTPDEAAGFITATILASLTPPGKCVPALAAPAAVAIGQRRTGSADAIRHRMNES